MGNLDDAIAARASEVSRIESWHRNQATEKRSNQAKGRAMAKDFVARAKAARLEPDVVLYGKVEQTYLPTEVLRKSGWVHLLDEHILDATETRCWNLDPRGRTQDVVGEPIYGHHYLLNEDGLVMKRQVTSRTIKRLFVGDRVLVTCTWEPVAPSADDEVYYTVNGDDRECFDLLSAMVGYFERHKALGS